MKKARYKPNLYNQTMMAFLFTTFVYTPDFIEDAL